MTKYTLEFYAPDGESVREGEFDNLEEAIDRWDNIGSRWIFFPIGVIFTPKGRVKLAPNGLEYLEGSYRGRFEKEINGMEVF